VDFLPDGGEFSLRIRSDDDEEIPPDTFSGV
jgi:hypothetical protein